MKRFKSAVASFSLAAFVVCMVHCPLENSIHPPFSVTSLHLDDSHHSSEHNCSTCTTCEWVHSGAILISHNADIGISTMIELSLLDSALDLKNIFRERVLASSPTTAPPELIKSWHFVFRTALPARAPSVLS